MTKGTNQASHQILSIDIGGSNIKATLLDPSGLLLRDYIRLATPSRPTPSRVMALVEKLAAQLPGYDYISAGFPGYVRDGMVYTAPNLDTEAWRGTNLAALLTQALGKPARVVNDADMHGLGVAAGEGLEMVVTLGTGFGTALLLNGVLLPHLELAHHPVTRKKDYDQYIGEAEMKRIGRKRWNARMKRVLEIIKTVVNYDTLYLGGGNVADINFSLDENIIVVSNKEGIKGGARLWQNEFKMV